MASDNLLRGLGDQLGRFISDPGAREDMQKSVNVLVQNALGRLDVVTREQFDAQLEKLQRAEQQLAAMEEQLAALQARIDTLEGN